VGGRSAWFVAPALNHRRALFMIEGGTDYRPRDWVRLCGGSTGVQPVIHRPDHAVSDQRAALEPVRRMWRAAGRHPPNGPRLSWSGRYQCSEVAARTPFNRPEAIDGGGAKTAQESPSPNGRVLMFSPSGSLMKAAGFRITTGNLGGHNYQPDAAGREQDPRRRIVTKARARPGSGEGCAVHRVHEGQANAAGVYATRRRPSV
jgi:hypothetical protein